MLPSCGYDSSLVDCVAWKAPYLAYPTYAEPMTGEDSWRPIFEFVKADMGNQLLWEPSQHSRVTVAVAKVVPWTITKCQVSRCPKVSRFFPVEQTHRLAALLFTDGSIEVLVEEIENLNHLRSRFSKPVALGIFVAGIAPVKHAPEELEREGKRMIGKHASGTVPKAAELPGCITKIPCSPGIHVEVHQ